MRGAGRGNASGSLCEWMPQGARADARGSRAAVTMSTPYPGAGDRGKLTPPGHSGGPRHPSADLMKEHPMTDSTTPQGSNPATDQPGEADETRKQAEDQSADTTQAGEETHGAAT